MSNYFRYENQPCPVCKENFQTNDDIVVCPVCGTPHHRDCYKKNGECGNFEKHNNGFRWAPENTNEPIKEQTNEPANNNVPPFMAGQPFNSQDASSTVFFGNGTNPLSLFPKEMEDGILTDEVAEFVGLNAPKYVQNFFYAKSHKRTFNWGAFFFTPYWFFYRKMYKLGAIFLAITLLLSVGFSFIPSVQKLYSDMTEWTEKYDIEDLETLTEEEIAQANDERNAFMLENPTGSILVMVQAGISLAIQVFIGFKANKWYYNHSIENIKKIKAEEPDVQKQRLLLFKSGGASMGAAFLAVLANNMVVMAAEMLMTFIK